MRPLASVLGPTDKLFEQFRAKFGAVVIDYDNLCKMDLDLTPPLTRLVRDALEAREWLQQHLLLDDFGRDDKREICELSIKYLDGEVC